MKYAIMIAAAVALGFTAPAIAADPAKSIVSLYHIAPGQQAGFLKWLDRQDQISAAAGVAKGQLYAHTDGDSWDYMVIRPVPTASQDKATDEAAKRMGVNPMHGGLELRKYIASHTDTFTIGPITAADYLSLVGEK